MAKITLTWSKLIPLKAEDIKKIGDINGVYRISKKSDNGKYYVYFVGSGININGKLLQHISASEPNMRLKKFIELGGDFAFKYATNDDTNACLAIEKQMYKTYQPEFNLEEPKSDLDLEANLN